MAIDPITVRDLFFNALELTSENRSAFLVELCGTDEELHAAVLRLLKAHADPASILESLSPAPTEATDQLVPDPFDAATSTEAGSPGEEAGAGQQGTRIGRYTLIELIGEGGMGLVYLASQSDPVKRQVALKLIKVGMDSQTILARFDAERQALALMDHPNIARIYDGGITATGQPFFVMELVKGIPITEYCDAYRLDVIARLRLFIAVCQAVQHAHQKGIIHRDLKPSNVLVTEVDGRPTPKVIDFGVAKATGQRLTDATLTFTGAIVGTPVYMSPEQADPTAVDIDTRTDVYALGIILYELLVGSTPIDCEKLKHVAILEILRMVREVDPQRPSEKLSTIDALPNISANRSIDPAKLSKMLHGELDCVVMKAIEKDRTRRYATANGLARDLERYLADEVVEARPPSRGYRLKKLIRRHKGQVLAASLLFLALVGGILGTSIGLVQARIAQQAESERNQELAEEKAKVEKRNQELAAEQLKVENRFELALKAIGIFHNGVSQDLMLRNPEFNELRTRLLTEAGQFYGNLEKHLQGEKDLKSRQALATGYTRLGDITQNVGDLQQAVKVYQKGVQLRRELIQEQEADEETHLELARNLVSLGDLLVNTNDSVGGFAAFREARILIGKRYQEAPTVSLEIELSLIQERIAWMLRHEGKSPEALAAFQEALSIQRRLVEANPSDTRLQMSLSQTYLNMGDLLSHMGQRPEGLIALQNCVNILERLTKENPHFLGSLSNSYHNLAVTLSMSGMQSEATTALQKSHAINQRLAKETPASSGIQQSLAKSYLMQGNIKLSARSFEEALVAYRKAQEIAESLVKANPTSLRFQELLAECHRTAGVASSQYGKPTEALAAFRAASRIHGSLVDANPSANQFQTYLAQGHRDISKMWSTLGNREEELKSLREAVSLYQKVVDANRAIPEDLNNLFRCQLELAGLLSTLGKTDEAEIASHQAKLSLAKIENRTPSINITLNPKQSLAQGFELLCASFSPDGKQTLTAGMNDTVRVWDISTGQEKLVLRGHSGRVHTAWYSPDGSRILTASSDQTARLWNAITGKEELCLRGHRSGVESASFSPDGLRVVTACWDGTAKIFDAITGTELLTYQGDVRSLHTATFSPDGNLVISGGHHGVVRIWESRTGKDRLIIQAHKSLVRSTYFSPDGNQILTAGHDQTARVWDAKSGIQIHLLQLSVALESASYSPDGRRILTVGGNGIAKIFDAETGVGLLRLWHPSWISKSAFSPNGRQIVTASRDGMVRIWDATAYELLPFPRIILP